MIGILNWRNEVSNEVVMKREVTLALGY